MAVKSKPDNPKWKEVCDLLSNADIRFRTLLAEEIAELTTNTTQKPGSQEVAEKLQEHAGRHRTMRMSLLKLAAVTYGEEMTKKAALLMWDIPIWFSRHHVLFYDDTDYSNMFKSAEKEQGE